MTLELRNCRRHRSVCKHGFQRQIWNFDKKIVPLEGI